MWGNAEVVKAVKGDGERMRRKEAMKKKWKR